MNTPTPTRAAWYPIELTAFLRTLAVTQSNGYVSPEYRAGYLSALSHVAGLLGLETPNNFVAPESKVLP